MKKFLILFLSILPYALHAQEYESLLSEEKTWIVYVKATVAPALGDIYSLNEYKLQGDTLIDGILFKREYMRWRNYNEETFGEWKPTRKWLGQKGAKLFEFFVSGFGENDPYDGLPRPILDYSLDVGDTFVYTADIYDQRTYRVSAVSNEIFENSSDKKMRKCICLSNERTNEPFDVWIEGIGSMRFGMIGTDFMLTGGRPTLLKCSEGESVLYEIPMPTDISKICTESTKLSEAIYDLQGRRVQGQPKHGVYIQNGRKVMVK